jgi:UDP-N-acetylglucosamine/UDP-N-acetylgalactosamine diphosphorylase
MVTEQELRSRYEQVGQGHVFQHVENLSDSEKEVLLHQLKGIQVEKLAPLLEAAMRSDNETSGLSNSAIQPFAGAVARSSDFAVVQSSRSTGMQAVAQGQVAALVLAGGQGTRLGFSGPKGMYDIGLPSHRTLFELMAERIKKLSSLAGGNNNNCVIPFYIMTSPLNHDDTVASFESKEYFGLGSSNVLFFRQGMLPCLTNEGKIIMEATDKVAMAPDGNGGIYPSLQSSGALDDMTRRGVKYLHVFSIDNALVKPADPVFIGYCIEQQADCANKVVWKAHAHEQVGVVASRNGKPCIVEYSEITKEMAEKTNDQGLLVYGAGNICNHFYTLDFIREKILPNMGNLYHVAHKKIPYYDEEKGETITPDTNNGIKLETFIFDVFPFSERMAVLDVERSEEFAPVKNKPGSPTDSPDTAREMISSLAKKWIVDAGGKLTGDLSSVCEISPSTSYNGEGLNEIAQDKKIACPFSL